MRILISGGTGLLGRAFIRRFNQHQFTLLVRPLSQLSTARRRARWPLPDSATLLENLADVSTLDGFDAVINLAGEPIIDRRWTRAQKDSICQSRWHATQSLVDLFAASRRPPGVFLSGSAIGVYGDRGEQPLDEAASIGGDDFPSRLCQRWESLAQQAAPHTRVVCLRTGIVLAAEGGALAKMLPPFKWGLGGRLGRGHQYMSWIHLRDHLNAMAHLLETDSLDGPVNLVAPSPVSNREFTHALGLALQRPTLCPVPSALLRLLLGESARLLLDSQRVWPGKLLASGFEFEFPTLEPALGDVLG